MIQSLAQCDKNIVKIIQNRVFLVFHPPELVLLTEEVNVCQEYSPPQELEVLVMEDFVQGTGVVCGD